jgi:DNA uptake protein ComE-like DNA-binding protein
VIIPRFFDTHRPVAAQIPKIEMHDTFRVNKSNVKKNFEPPRRVRKKAEPFDINSADTSAFIALPGIGSKLAARIVLFRDRLGGFYEVEQIREVYGLQDSVFQKISPLLKCNGNNVRKININDAEKEVLKGHPYIRWEIANALVAYRDQHGSFHSAEDLGKLENIDRDALKKIMPYISFK